MSLRLKQIFDSCPWENKFLNRLPENEAEIAFRWYDEAADNAEKFFADLGSFASCSEIGPLHRRSLYFGRDAQGKWLLCVHEVPNQNHDPEDHGRGHGCTMDPIRTI